jgi:hypothetical protein
MQPTQSLTNKLEEIKAKVIIKTIELELARTLDDSCFLIFKGLVA